MTIALRDRGIDAHQKEVAMTPLNDTKSNRRLAAKLAAGLAISAMLALGTFTGSASAKDPDAAKDHAAAPARPHAAPPSREAARVRDPDGDHRNWNGGYRAPPVVYGSPYRSGYYGSPYNYPPPLVYGPVLGVGVPGLNIRIGG
jgi:hypothetical protein